MSGARARGLWDKGGRREKGPAGLRLRGYVYIPRARYLSFAGGCRLGPGVHAPYVANLRLNPPRRARDAALWPRGAGEDVMDEPAQRMGLAPIVASGAGCKEANGVYKPVGPGRDATGRDVQAAGTALTT